MSQTKIPEEQKVIDKFVGKQLRLMRLNLNMSQTELGDLVDVTFQQIQKYERGANRIGSSRLWQFCKVLNVEPNYFFEGLKSTKTSSEISDSVQSVLLKRQNHRLLKSFDNIAESPAKSAVIELCEALSDKAPED